MGTQALKTGDTHKVANNGTAVMLFLTILDTTWRLFAPTIGLTVIGVVLDNMFQTKPWFTAIGVTIGALVSFLLVYQQLKRIKS